MSSLVAIVGPTASGKSALALFLAERLGGEIVNYDSLQLYRHFDIGTAKPPDEERRRAPHHLLDVLEPAQVCSAGEYARQAAGIIGGILGRGRLPVLAGGTGFYLRALLQGLFAGPPRDEQLRQRLRERGRARPSGYLHRLLRRLDPASAARIHANDAPKLIRAIEVSLRARRPMSALFHEARGQSALAGIHARKIGLDPPRRLLYERINHRAARMFEAGLVEEVRGILASGVAPQAKPFESVGYKEALGVVQQRITPAEAIEATQFRTRHYAKRQMTWFRRERDVHWLRAFGDDPAARQAALDWLLGELRVKS
jgi:tRNA dimethylallyltransferase